MKTAEHWLHTNQFPDTDTAYSNEEFTVWVEAIQSDARAELEETNNKICKQFDELNTRFLTSQLNEGRLREHISIFSEKSDLLRWESMEMIHAAKDLIDSLDSTPPPDNDVLGTLKAVQQALDWLADAHSPEMWLSGEPNDIASDAKAKLATLISNKQP